MDQEKSKTSSPTNGVKSQIKPQQRHQEHNYTNPPVDETTVSKTETAGETDVGDNHRVRNSGYRLGNSSQYKADSSQRQSVQPTSTSSSDRHPIETKSRVIRKDVFNRIRRSEEELQKAAEMVRGGMTFQTASDTFNIPISTIRFSYLESENEFLLSRRSTERIEMSSGAIKKGKKNKSGKEEKRNRRAKKLSSRRDRKEKEPENFTWPDEEFCPKGGEGAVLVEYETTI